MTLLDYEYTMFNVTEAVCRFFKHCFLLLPGPLSFAAECASEGFTPMGTSNFSLLS
jgi:hypothetical protein